MALSGALTWNFKQEPRLCVPSRINEHDLDSSALLIGALLIDLAVVVAIDKFSPLIWLW